MKLSRREMLTGVCVGITCAAFAPTILGREVILTGYLKPYSVAGDVYLLTPSPFHCFECYVGNASEIIKLRIIGGIPTCNAKVEIKGVLLHSEQNTQVMATHSPMAEYFNV
jgi:hypothetical protein